MVEIAIDLDEEYYQEYFFRTAGFSRGELTSDDLSAFKKKATFTPTLILPTNIDVCNCKSKRHESTYTIASIHGSQNWFPIYTVI